jgi:DNA adenine methylase
VVFAEVAGSQNLLDTVLGARTLLGMSPEPFLRWAGGKRQLLPVLIPTLPADFDLTKNRFFEPFTGGGAFQFALSGHNTAAGLFTPRKKKGLPIVLNDANQDLVATYRVIRDDVEGLIVELRRMAKDISEKRYYAVRDAQPTTELGQAARTIYLNRLGFNGLYRVNASGKFNVPYGKLTNPTVCDEDLLRACSAWLRHAEVRSGSYASAVADAKAGDVVYLDPPYIPLTPTASFSRYAKDDFREMDQWGLAGVIKGLADRGVRVMFSNSNTELTRKIFGADLDLYAVNASRSIGANAASRATVEEVLGVNYPLASALDGSVAGRLRQLTTRV